MMSEQDPSTFKTGDRWVQVSAGGLTVQEASQLHTRELQVDVFLRKQFMVFFLQIGGLKWAKKYCKILHILAYQSHKNQRFVEQKNNVLSQSFSCTPFSCCFHKNNVFLYEGFYRRHSLFLLDFST